MKKLLCFILALTMLFGISSCKKARLEYWGISETDYSDIDFSEDNSLISEESGSGDEYGGAPLMWKVTSADGDGVVWLFGSIHVADESAYPLPAVVMEAFYASDYLAVEVNINDIDFESFNFNDYMYYQDGSTIDRHISDQLYKDAVALLREYYYYRKTTFDVYKPFVWQDLISDYYLYLSGLSRDYGIDDYFLVEADEDGKTILAVESMELQLGMMSGFSDGLQELMLSDTVYSTADDYVNSLLELYEAWKTGDIQTLTYYAVYDFETDDYTQEELAYISEYETAMMTDRNIGMAQTAESYLAEGKKVFFVVGAAHMLGSHGIVQLLTDAGYRVEPVKTASGN